VVVPTLDEERWIASALERVAAGGPRAPADRADRVVVADGGSSDRTCEIARAYGAEVVRAPTGRGSQLAAGAALLDTELLLFLHADCIPAEGALAEVRRAFADERLRAAALSQKIEAPGLFYRLVERAADLRVRWLGVVYGDSSLVVRRAAYLDAGGFPPLALFEDVELSRRLRRSARPRLLPSATVRVSARRWEEEGRSRATLRNWILALAYFSGADPERLARHYAPHSTGLPRRGGPEA